MKAINVSHVTKRICLAALLLILHGSANGAQANFSQNNRAETGHRYDQRAGQGSVYSDKGRPERPPQEAIEACSGKNKGDKVEFETPRGDLVSGTCVVHGDLVFAVPEKGPPNQKGGARQQRRN